MKHSERSADNGFAQNPLNRWSDKRGDEAFMAAMRARPDARALVFAGELALLQDDGNPLFSLSDAAALGAARELLFLGEGAEGPLFAEQV